jgi:hypothetical protein
MTIEEQLAQALAENKALKDRLDFLEAVLARDIIIPAQWHLGRREAELIRHIYLIQRHTGLPVSREKLLALASANARPKTNKWHAALGNHTTTPITGKLISQVLAMVKAKLIRFDLSFRSIHKHGYALSEQMMELLDQLNPEESISPRHQDQAATYGQPNQTEAPEIAISKPQQVNQQPSKTQ